MSLAQSSAIDSSEDVREHRHCFHCGLPVDAHTREQLVVFDKPRDFCCHGCRAVCKTIVDSGLGDYYQNRDLGVSSNTQKDLQKLLEKLSIYDNENVQKSFVHGEEGWQEAYLILEGIRCSACVWLNELHLRQQPGVIDVHIDDITQRARVRWDPEQIALSEILAAILSIGYQAHPYEPSHYLELQKNNNRKNLHRLLFAGIIGMIPMHFALATWFLGGPDEQGELQQWELIGRWTSLMVTFSLMVYPAQEFFFGVWSDLKRRIIGMDVPIVIGLSCAFLLSAYSTVTGSGEVYFESIAMFVLFILLSRRLEHQARIQASDQLERLALSQPLEANLIQDDGQIQVVSVTELEPGQSIQILPGAQVPVDCEITRGESTFNEALITGESKAINHTQGDLLMAGSLNYDQPVTARVHSAEMDSTIAEITRLAESGLQQKPAQSILADRVANRFVLFILLIALMTSIYWWSQGEAEWLVITVSVLIVTCPCALALAVPIALTLSSSRLLRLGVLPLNMSVINTLEKVDLFVFDKTGTLTRGKPGLLDIHWFQDQHEDQKQEQVLGVVKALVAQSEHPIAKATHEAIEQDASQLDSLTNHVGLGIEAEYKGQWRFGRIEFVESVINQLSPEQRARFDEIIDQHYSLSCLTHDEQLVAVFLFEDSVREGCDEVIQDLHDKGVKTVILSGDTQKSVAYLAKELGVMDFEYGLKPEQKMAWVKARQAEGHRVAMVGDGINDAPTLATADVSFSLAESTALANNHSDFLVMGTHLTPIPQAITLAGNTLTRIRQNIAWAILYNLIAIPFAVAGWVPPWAAAIGMSLSSAIVVLNSIRLNKQKID